MNIGIIGFGKMGQGIAKLLEKDMELKLIVDSIEVDKKTNNCIYSKHISDINDKLLDNIDVFIEFTGPNVARQLILDLIKRKKGLKLISGSTGWDFDSIKNEIQKQEVLFLRSSNFSIGVNVMCSALELISKALFKTGNFDAAMVEYHHKAKLDSPSGTAKMLAEYVNKSGYDMSISCVRSGHYPGLHTVSFDALNETLDITHTARSRDVFCQGVVLAVKWLNNKNNASVFSFKDVIADVLGGRI